MGSDARAVELPEGWGTLAVHPVEDRDSLLGDPRPHARLADGRTVVWLPPPRAGRAAAVDAESAAAELPMSVRRLLGASGTDAIGEWTRLEVAAKVTATPVIILLREHWKASRNMTLTTLHLDDLVVSVGWAQ